jgi:uncharacterized protein (TIGR02118 family)
MAATPAATPGTPAPETAPARSDQQDAHTAYCLSVIYPNQPGSQFDLAYYVETHMRLVADRLGPGGMLRYELANGVGGWPPETQTPNVMICNMYFSNLDDLLRSFGTHGPELIADIRVYTDIRPQMQISEILA